VFIKTYLATINSCVVDDKSENHWEITASLKINPFGDGRFSEKKVETFQEKLADEKTYFSNTPNLQHSEINHQN